MEIIIKIWETDKYFKTGKRLCYVTYTRKTATTTIVKYHS